MEVPGYVISIVVDNIDVVVVDNVVDDVVSCKCHIQYSTKSKRNTNRNNGNKNSIAHARITLDTTRLNETEEDIPWAKQIPIIEK